MVKRRNSRYKAFDWGAPRRVPIDCTPQPAGPMLAPGALLVPVPLHRWRLWRRGFNQAALLGGFQPGHHG